MMLGSRWIVQAGLVGIMGLTSGLMPMPTMVPAALAQATSNYNTYMQQGYSATARRDYQTALVNFKRALSAKPGDRYATVAISNVQAYIARDRQASNRPGRNRLAYIPSNLGMPGNTVAGATRGLCIPGEVPLTALSPKNNLALTASAAPELFFYVPASIAKTTELLVLDEAGNIIEQKNYPLPSRPGIVRIPMNPATTALAVGKKYSWSLSLVCSNDDPSGNPFVQGWVERVEIDPNMMQAINSTPPADRLPLFAANQLWNETLSTMAQLQESNPNNSAYHEQWKSFLEEAGVKPNIANMPLVK